MTVGTPSGDTTMHFGFGGCKQPIDSSSRVSWCSQTVLLVVEGIVEGELRSQTAHGDMGTISPNKDNS